MKLFKNSKLDYMQMGLLISLAAFVLPLLLMCDVLPHNFFTVLLSIVVGLVVLVAAWADDLVPKQPVQIKIAGISLFMFCFLTFILLGTSIFI